MFTSDVNMSTSCPRRSSIMLKLAFASSLPLRTSSTVRRADYTSPARFRVPITSVKRVRRSENVPGNVYVDSSCIDCDTCRWLAPETFQAENGMSAVYAQPSSTEAQLQAMRAAAACPTGSIRTTTPLPITRQARDSFPLPAPDRLTSTHVPDVFYNGYASPDTFGGASWLVLNHGSDPYAIMFDCPRFFRPLAKAIKKMAEPFGGVRYLVLSHQDDVAGHAEWAREFGAKRVIHKRECNARQGTSACEMQLEDSDFPYDLAEGAQLVHVPGHTSGSIAMLHNPTASLFTGDHFFYSSRTGRLGGSRYIMHSRDALIHSVEILSDLPFLHGFPGHGRHFHFKDGEDRREQIDAAVDFMKAAWRP